ncbi:MAG TPA: FAD-dependent oxidoreductase, partial [Ktedonobacteraceae bacterium]
MVVGDVTTAVDVLVLGGGPAGYVAAIHASQLGRHVTLVESGPIGGTCLNRRCIPLKALLASSERYYGMRLPDLASMGIHAETVTFDWATMQAWKQGVVDRLSGGVRHLLAGYHVEIVAGLGWFINGREVRVEGEYGSHRFKFEHCVIATGSGAASLPSMPYDEKNILTPEQALCLTELPETLSVFGDDYIALELATLFARLGVRVKLYTPGEQLLAHADKTAMHLVQAGLRKLGVQVATKTQVDAITERPLVVSAGVQPATGRLHAQDAGFQLYEPGGIVVDS